MKNVTQIYIGGQFVTPHGTEKFELVNPTTGQVTGHVTLGDAEDTRLAIQAAKKAFVSFSKSTKKERGEILLRLHAAVSKRSDEHRQAMLEEYGGPFFMADASAARAGESFLQAKAIMDSYDFEKTVGVSKVILEPIGVVGIITPWNASSSFVCSKLSMAIATGCTTVIKPSEMSAVQTQILLECFHEAGLPPGLVNVVNGRGDVVGAEITKSRDITKISFTGSTVVGKTIARGAVDTMKRVTLELGGKSPNIILDDADLEKAIPMAVMAAFMNNGQACVAGTRLLVPEKRLEEIEKLLIREVEKVRVGDPTDRTNIIGPLVNQKQYERVQNYIQIGINEGAKLLIGGTGHPKGLDQGYFVRPTVFVGVTPEMTIAREEIFGPVLSVLTYKTEDEAIAMANDTDYGLQAYVSSANEDRAMSVARQLLAGRVMVNTLKHDPLAPFGGYKQSGTGREYGIYGMEEYLETKAVLT